jgi:hypothetical protein
MIDYVLGVEEVKSLSHTTGKGETQGEGSE